ncbi:MAG: GYD domain-containing protein [Gammaproteobacteria bacterium]|nr:GYD domain-containing protein [Gammaproteobacteria bacterium]
MATFIMLTRLSPEAANSPNSLADLEARVMKQIRSECPEIKWLHSYAVLGPYEYLDIFEAPDIETATKVSTLVRIYGHAKAEVWAATEWGRFKELMRGMPRAA